MYQRVFLVDPVTNEELTELGFFRSEFAAEFIERWRQYSEIDAAETRVAVAEPAPQIAAF